MHTDSAILINPVATHFNVTGDVLAAYKDYKASSKEGKGNGQVLEDLLMEIERMERTQEIGRGVIDDYRRNFRALHELRASQNSNRNPNDDLVFLRDLVNSQFAFTNAEMDLDLEKDIPILCLSRRAQSTYLELAINAVRHGKATKLLAKTENIKATEKGFISNMVGIHIYNNGLAIPESKDVFEVNLKTETSSGFGLKSAKARIELNGGILRVEPSDIPGYQVHFAIYLPTTLVGNNN
jgi:signal transduction histidine kinase